MGTKYKNMSIGPIFINLAIPLIKPIWAYYYYNELYCFLIKLP